MTDTTFTNTDKLDQVDWDGEIATVPKADTDEEQGERLSAALRIWVMIQHYLEPQIKTATEDNRKADFMRILHYFYGKFVYHHALFYDKPGNLYDVKQYQREGHPLDNFKKRLGDNLQRSELPLANIKAIEKLLMSEIVKERAEIKKQDGGYGQVKSLMEAQGLKIVKPKGLRKEGDRDTVCTIHDGVRYHMYMMKDAGSRDKVRTEKYAKEKLDNHKEVIARYHPLVKSVYKAIKKFKDIGDVWAMEGGGMQSQVFFGNEKGYIAILYLDMKKSKKKLQPEYTLQVNGNYNDPLFDGFDVPGVKVRTNFSVYGNSLD